MPMKALGKPLSRKWEKELALYSAAQARIARCTFRFELHRLHTESGCPPDVPVTCAGIGGILGIFPLNSQPPLASASERAAAALARTPSTLNLQVASVSLILAQRALGIAKIEQPSTAQR